jgi:hypothetical protein
MDHLRDSTPKHFQRWELGGPKIWSQATRVVAAFGFGGFLSHGEHRNHPKSAEKPWFWDHFVGLFFEKFREGMRFKWKMDENGDKPLDGMEDHILQQTHC